MLYYGAVDAVFVGGLGAAGGAGGGEERGEHGRLNVIGLSDAVSYDGEEGKKIGEQGRKGGKEYERGERDDR
jgi:hypothetical protein